MLKVESIRRSNPGPWGDGITVVDRTGSTNDDLKAAARRGAPDGTVLIAEEQERGRGRLGRSWRSPAGQNLYLSVLVRPRIDRLEALPVRALVAGVAIAGAIEETAAVRTRLKWPNDLLIGRRKVCGVLAEASDTRPVAFVLGVGINVNQRDFPPDLAEIATSLSLCAGGEIDRAALAAAVLRHLHACFLRLDGEGPTPLLDRWMELSDCRGRAVRTDDGRRGRISGVAPSGALLVTAPSGEVFPVIGGPITEE